MVKLKLSVAGNTAAIVPESALYSKFRVISSVPMVNHKTRCLLALVFTAYSLYTHIMTAKQVIKLLEANGWVLDRIEGSHHIFMKEGRRSVPVPVHGNRDISPLSERILKQAGIG